MQLSLASMHSSRATERSGQVAQDTGSLQMWGACEVYSSPPLPFFFLLPPTGASPVFFWCTMNLV